MTMHVVNATTQTLAKMFDGMRTGQRQTQRCRGGTWPCPFKGFPRAIVTKIFHGRIAKVAAFLSIRQRNDFVIGPGIEIVLPMLFAALVVQGRSRKAGPHGTTPGLANVHKNQRCFVARRTTPRSNIEVPCRRFGPGRGTSRAAGPANRAACLANVNAAARRSA